MRHQCWCVGALCLTAVCASGWAEEAKSSGAGLAKTRPEMKRQIEAVKERKARLPLPERTPAEMGERYLPNSNRLKALYLPESWQSSRPNSGGPGQGPGNGQGQGQFNNGQRQGQPNNGSGQGQFNNGQGQGQFNGQGRGSNRGPDMNAPEYPFKKRMFWIVSRTNDSRYCMGHQEQGLQRIGMTDNQIASLDCNWSEFPADEQAGMRFARKLTLTPHLINSEDIQSLRKYFTDQQVMDIIQSIAGNNSMNRWTGATGIPQDNSRELLDTPTSGEFATIESKVAPFDHQPRPAWESRTKAEATMAACLERMTGMKLSGQREAIARDGKLNPKLKAQIAWVCARENHAWYSATQARANLNALDVSDGVLFAIGGNEAAFTPAERATFAFSRKLTSAPHTINDEDVAGLRKLFSDHEVAEIIFLICEANSFDRMTESMRLLSEASTKSPGQTPLSNPASVEGANREALKNAYTRPVTGRPGFGGPGFGRPQEKMKQDDKFPTQKPAVGDAIPDVTVYTTDGKPMQTAELRGQYSVLVFGCLT